MTPPLYKMGVVLPLELSEGMDVFMTLLFATSFGSTLSFLAGEAGVAHAGLALTVAAASCLSFLTAAFFAALFAAACSFLLASFFFHSLQGGF